MKKCWRCWKVHRPGWVRNRLKNDKIGTEKISLKKPKKNQFFWSFFRTSSASWQYFYGSADLSLYWPGCLSWASPFGASIWSTACSVFGRNIKPEKQPKHSKKCCRLTLVSSGMVPSNKYWPKIWSSETLFWSPKAIKYPPMPDCWKQPICRSINPP